MSRLLILSLVLATAFAGAAGARAEEPLTNDSLAKMLASGVPFSLVRDMLQKAIDDKTSGGPRYQLDCSPEKLIEIQQSATKGGMDKKDIEKLLHLVCGWRDHELARLRELVDQFMNGCINSEEPQQYAVSVRTLLREGKSVIPELLRHIDEESDRKRVGVLDALAQLGDKGETVVRAVRLMLGDREKTVRAAAAKTYAALAGLAVQDELLAQLQGPGGRPDYVDGIVMTLGYLADTRAVGSLTRFLKTSRDLDGRLAAAWALGELRAKDKESVDALLDAVLDERDPRIRAVAARSLGQIEEPRAVEYIIRACQRYEKKGQAELLSALAAFRTKKSVEFLIERVASDDPALRRAAIATLRTLTNEANLSAQEDWKDWYFRAKDRTDWFKPDVP